MAIKNLSSYDTHTYAVTATTDLTSIYGPDIGDAALVITTGDVYMYDGNGHWYNLADTTQVVTIGG